MTLVDITTNRQTRRPGIEAFPHYYVGINSLADLATKEDRVCVLNILGNESKSVTPTSHVYSGGNIVCGVMPGRSGSLLKTELGDIPVYNSVVEALQAGHQFNVAVVYVPPAGVKDAVIEAVRVNPELKKVIILTEKVPLSDARMIRHYCQQQRVDVFGGNCLGIADAHQRGRGETAKLAQPPVNQFFGNRGTDSGSIPRFSIGTNCTSVNDVGQTGQTEV